MMGAVLPANLLAARASERFGAPAIIAAGAAIAAAGCVALIGIDRGTNYWMICVQLVAIGGGLGLLVPPLTSTLLGSVEKARSGGSRLVFSKRHETDRQRPGRSPVWIAGSSGERVYYRRSRITDYLRDTSTRRSDNDCDRRPQAEEIIFQSLTRIGTFKFWRKTGVIESLFRFRHQTKRPFRGRAGR